jgi:hypothetical protein
VLDLLKYFHKRGEKKSHKHLISEVLGKAATKGSQDQQLPTEIIQLALVRLIYILLAKLLSISNLAFCV